MPGRTSKRLSSIGGYAFAEIGEKVEGLKKRGINPINFGVGDPTEPTPEIVRRAIKDAVDLRAGSGYPSYIGSLEYRRA
ncbi:MAG TPA: LL-diaminopimelate aminotransferase, partial [bacterium]|nr:LL-diaminopimelate aminotransferase [bacterium]